MRRYLFIFFLFFSVFLNVFGEDFTEISILVFDKNKNPLENVNINIGDLALKTDSQGLSKTFLFPAYYDIEINKLNYFSIKSSIEVSTTNNQLVFYLESMFTDVNIKVTDSLSGGAIASSIKVTDLVSGESSFSSTNNSGDLIITLKKDEQYLFEINEKSYKNYSFKIDTSKLLSSSFLFKLERLEAKVIFNLNVNKGKLSVKLSENGISYTELDFNSSQVTLSIPYGQYDIVINSENYNTLVSSLNFSNELEEKEFQLKAQFKKFIFYPLLSDTETLLFIKDNALIGNDDFAKKSSLKIYKDNSLINTFVFLDNPIELNLNYGIYTFELSNISSDPYKIENVSLQEDTPDYILIKLKKLFATLNGSIQAEDSLLGGVKIRFEDKEGFTYSSTSSIDGSFSIKLPPRPYDIFIEKDGYRLINDQKKYIDFLELNGVYDFNILLEEIPSQITGKITTLTGKPINKARVTLKVGKNEEHIFTNSNGEYEAFVKSGLVFIKIDKPGHKSKGTVKNINKFSTLTNMNFQLEQIFSSIDGLLTDGSSPIEGFKIKVLDENNNLISSNISKNNGLFKIENLPILEQFYLLIEEPGYVKYKSELLSLNTTPITDYHIILIKDSASIIIELKNENKDPLVNEEVLVNQVKLKTDINGFLETEVKFQENDFYIPIEILSYNFKDRIKIFKTMNSPFRKEIVIPSKKSEEPILDPRSSVPEKISPIEETINENINEEPVADEININIENKEKAPE